MAKGQPNPTGDPQRQAALKHGLQQYGAGNPAAGEQAARSILLRNSRDVQALGLLAMCLVQLARLDEALQAADQALALAPREPMLLTLRARAQRLMGRTEEALADYRRALAIQPGMETAASGAAELLLSVKRLDEAETLLAPLLAGPIRNHQVALAAARLHRLRGDTGAGVALLEGGLRSPGLPPAARVDLMFALADLLDVQGDTARAIAMVQQANQMRGSRFDPAGHRAAVERFLHAFTRAGFDAMPRAEQTGDLTPIFIVGLPRSGTTLVERILAAHSQVTAAGELDGMQRLVMDAQAGQPLPWVMQDASAWTTAQVSAARSRWPRCVLVPIETPFVTDKMPANVMYLPLIRLAYPEAPIIRCLRDPRDTAVSCYFQHFGAANDWAYHPEHLVAYFADVERVYGHCRDVLGIDLLEVSYEQLVQDPRFSDPFR